MCSHELRVLETKNNSISVGLSVGLEGRAATHLGSQLFTRGVSGTRVVTHITKVTTILRPWYTLTYIRSNCMADPNSRIQIPELLVKLIFFLLPSSRIFIQPSSESIFSALGAISPSWILIRIESEIELPSMEYMGIMIKTYNLWLCNLNDKSVKSSLWKRCEEKEVVWCIFYVRIDSFS